MLLCNYNDAFSREGFVLEKKLLIRLAWKIIDIQERVLGILTLVISLFLSFSGYVCKFCVEFSPLLFHSTLLIQFKIVKILFSTFYTLKFRILK